jgi:hypothetical protein
MYLYEMDGWRTNKSPEKGQKDKESSGESGWKGIEGRGRWKMLSFLFVLAPSILLLFFFTFFFPLLSSGSFAFYLLLASHL